MIPKYFLYSTQRRLVGLLLIIFSIHLHRFKNNRIFILNGIPRSLLRGFQVLAKSVPGGAKFRNTPSACGGDRNFEDFSSLLDLLQWVNRQPEQRGKRCGHSKHPGLETAPLNWNTADLGRKAKRLSGLMRLV